MKSRETHGLRAMLSSRRALLNKTIDLTNEVRGLLKIFGIRLPRTIRYGSFGKVGKTPERGSSDGQRACKSRF